MHRLRRGIVVGMLLAAAVPIPAGAATSTDAAGIPLIDQTGARFRLADLRGTPTVVTFIATRCTDMCPMVDAMFSSLARDSRVPGRLLTITLDPEYDTPFVMARYARELHAPPNRWRVASGNAHDVERIIAAFGVEREYDKDGIPDAHSSFIYVFDTRGRLTKTLPLSTNTLAEVRDAVRRAAS